MASGCRAIFQTDKNIMFEDNTMQVSRLKKRPGWHDLTCRTRLGAQYEIGPTRQDRAIRASQSKPASVLKINAADAGEQDLVDDCFFVLSCAHPAPGLSHLPNPKL